MSAKDSLARGAKSATFLGGTPEVDAPIKFNKTVAAELLDCNGDLVVRDRRPVYDDTPLPEPEPLAPFDASRYYPLNEWVLLERITAVDALESKFIPEQYRSQSTKARVLSVSPNETELKIGNVVLFLPHGTEDAQVGRPEIILCPKGDILLVEQNG